MDRISTSLTLSGNEKCRTNVFPPLTNGMSGKLRQAAFKIVEWNCTSRSISIAEAASTIRTPPIPGQDVDMSDDIVESVKYVDVHA